MIRRRVTMKTQTTASGGVGLGRGGRMSRQRKRDAVLRLLRGEDLETLSRALGATAATLTGWQDPFVAAGEASLATRSTAGEALETERQTGRDASTIPRTSMQLAQRAARSLRWTRAGAQPLTVFKSMSGAMNPKITSQMAGIAPRATDQKAKAPAGWKWPPMILDYRAQKATKDAA